MACKTLLHWVVLILSIKLALALKTTQQKSEKRLIQ